MEKVHFRLTSVAQKSCWLSSLVRFFNLTEKSFSIIDFIGGHWRGKGLALGRRCTLYSFLRYTSPFLPLLTPSYPFLPLLPQMQTYWKHNILVLSLDFKRACSNYYVRAGQIHFIFAQRSWKERYNIIQSRCAFFALWFILVQNDVPRQKLKMLGY